MSGVWGQFIILALNLLIGGGLGVLFDLYRFLRLRTRPGWLWTQVADFLFWVIAAAIVFGVYFHLTRGEARLLMLLLIPVGMGAYLKLLSPRLRWRLFGFFALLGSCLRLLLWFSLLPWRLLADVCSLCYQLSAGVLRLILLPFRRAWRALRKAALAAWRSLWKGRPPGDPPS